MEENNQVLRLGISRRLLDWNKSMLPLFTARLKTGRPTAFDLIVTRTQYLIWSGDTRCKYDWNPNWFPIILFKTLLLCSEMYRDWPILWVDRPVHRGKLFLFTTARCLSWSVPQVKNKKQQITHRWTTDSVNLFWLNHYVPSEIQNSIHCFFFPWWFPHCLFLTKKEKTRKQSSFVLIEWHGSKSYQIWRNVVTGNQEPLPKSVDAQFLAFGYTRRLLAKKKFGGKKVTWIEKTPP